LRHLDPRIAGPGIPWQGRLLGLLALSRRAVGQPLSAPDAVLDTRRADRVSDARHKDSRGVRVDRSDSGAERDRCRP